MKLSDETFEILKNFSYINNNLMLKPGNFIMTKSPQNDVLAKAKISEDIPESAGIYDLHKFLSMLTLLDEPDISFEGKQFKISSGRKRANYTYASERVIVYPDYDMKPQFEFAASFKLSWDDIESANKASNLLQLNDIRIHRKDDGSIQLIIIDANSPTSDSYELDIPTEVPVKPFKDICYEAKRLKLLRGDYNVGIVEKGLIEFSTDNLTYWITAKV